MQVVCGDGGSVYEGGGSEYGSDGSVTTWEGEDVADR